tara:strand:- start:781 stop:1065 length:285 start_codon:yes stop_codon:yes gene_type:complete
MAEQTCSAAGASAWTPVASGAAAVVAFVASRSGCTFCDGLSADPAEAGSTTAGRRGDTVARPAARPVEFSCSPATTRGRRTDGGAGSSLSESSL